MRRTLSLIAVLVLALAVTPGGVARAVTAGQPLVFHEITPCALFDTRPSQGGTGIMAANETRTFHVVGSTSNFAGQGGTAGGCNIPGFSGGQPQTQMVYLNLVAVDPVQGGNLKVWATTDPEPMGGVVNYQKLTPNLNNSNSIVVGVRQDTEGDDIAVKANVGSVHVRGVALGYLTTASNSFWALGGNAGTTGSHFVGTTDNTALNFRVNDQRAFRLEPHPTSPNVIGGFSGNAVTAGALAATIGGGGASTFTNRVTDDFGTVGGGWNNRAGDGAGTTSDRPFATVGGGRSNTASGDAATVGGGDLNTASGEEATVGGGIANTASGTQATVGGGDSNTATGLRATVPGGVSNAAAGDLSFAAGRRAKANHAGAFVWGDNTAAEVASSADNQFTARTSGGARFFSNSTLTTGVTLAAGGGSWASVSDRAVKANLRAVAPGEILAQVAELPITTWNYTSQDDSIRHIGPTAQDFHAAFGVGEDERHITAVDADGVALAAIQGLNEKLEAEIASREGGGSGSPVLPTGAWVALAAALGMLGLGLGRRWERRTGAA